MNRIKQRLQALENGNGDGARIGDMLDLLDLNDEGAAFRGMKVNPAVLRSLDAMSDD